MLLLHIAHGMLEMGNSLALPQRTLPLANITLPPVAPSPIPTAIPTGSAANPFQDLAALTTSIQSFVFGLGLTVFLIGITIAGIMRMVAFGSERRIATSNMALTAAVVGLIIMLLGTALSSAFLQIFPQQ